ncbi:MAG: hypothetical protein K2X63_02250, partial [Burkholderiaceae bacterium]|nr:hypothetical protein [Burkholderiaceae bacterium]
MKPGLARYLARWRGLQGIFNIFKRLEQHRKIRWSVAALLSLCVLLDQFYHMILHHTACFGNSWH